MELYNFAVHILFVFMFTCSYILFYVYHRVK